MRFSGLILSLLAICFSFGISAAFAAVDSYKGVSLYDLYDASQDLDATLAPIALPVRKYVLIQKDLKLTRVDTVSLVSLKIESNGQAIMVVDVFGADKRFMKTDWKTKTGHGFLRVEVALRSEQALSEPVREISQYRVTGHKLLSSHDLAELNLKMEVSLSDRVAVVSDAVTGFRRIYPLGVGAIDRVRYRRIVTLMTPTTEVSVLSKNHLYRERTDPPYYKGKPFIPLRVPTEYPTGDAKGVRYRTSAIAFHIWQETGFARGFLSHGCIRMRNWDLDELLILVLGTRENIPIRIQTRPLVNVQHPYPYLISRYNEVFNAGTPENPKSIKVEDEHGVKLTKTVSVSRYEPGFKLPLPYELTGVSLDPAIMGMGPMPLMEEYDITAELGAAAYRYIE